MEEQKPAPTVSVVLCTFNGAAYVAQQLGSILTQTRPVDELVIADDGSTDDTVDVVDATIAEHAARHPGSLPRLVRLSGDRPLGVAANFERAMRAATADLLALCDQDDVWHPTRVERMLASFDAEPSTALVHGDARLVDAAGSDLGSTLFGALGLSARERAEIAAGDEFAALLRRNLVTGATTMLRADVRDRALPIPEGWIHDEWIAMVAAATSVTSLVDEALLDYRQHGANQIGVQRITLTARLDRLRQPRQPRNARLLVRARSLVERLARLEGVAPERLALARRKFAHEGRRSALPAARLLRVAGVLEGALRGDYTRFGGGAQDALRDLVQPAS
ncbi:hypothetical protein BH11ACT3_BH11ACT3_06910 [soil metagenome]